MEKLSGMLETVGAGRNAGETFRLSEGLLKAGEVAQRIRVLLSVQVRESPPQSYPLTFTSFSPPHT